MLHMATPMLLGSSKNPYDAFVQHITARATSGLVAWGGRMDTYYYNNPALVLITAGPTDTGIMAGTTWGGGGVIGGTSMAKAIRHGLPSEAEFNAQMANGLKMFASISYVGELTSFLGTTRNGFTASSYNTDEPQSGYVMTELVFWSAGQAWKMIPSSTNGPNPYSF